MKITDKTFEYQYAESLRYIIESTIDGRVDVEKTSNRTGVDTYGIQHQYFFIKDAVNNLPLLKGKKIYPKHALIELFWMLNGKTDVKWLNDRGVNYWNNWKNSEGTIGKGYGYQFRNFNGIDNLQQLIYRMISMPDSRSLILNLWNIADINNMVLQPCFYDFHFRCIYNEETVLDQWNEPMTFAVYNVDLHVTQRSSDAFIGLPYDVMFATYFLAVICELASKDKTNHEPIYFQPRNIHFVCHDYHIYENHLDAVNKYLTNFDENKNNVIDGIAKLSSKFIQSTDLYDYLRIHDETKYDNFSLDKNYTDEYGLIKAPIAI